RAGGGSGGDAGRGGGRRRPVMMGGGWRGAREAPLFAPPVTRHPLRGGMSIEGIGRFCFGASYAVALGLGVVNAARPRRPPRYAAVAFGAAGLVAHTLYLALHRPSVALPSGSLLVLAWVVAVFGVVGAVHHRKLAWAVFVLPLVLALIGLAQVF